MSNLQLVIISILSWGVGSLFYKVANDSIHPIMVSTIVTAMYVVLTPLSLVIFKVNYNINTTGVVYSLLGGFTMCLGSIAFFYALQKGAAGEVTVLTSLYPALTLILSIAFMKEELSFKKAVGVGLALLSVFILSKK